MKNGMASSAKALTEANRVCCSAASGTCMKKTSATVTAVSKTRKIGKPSSSSAIGTTARAKVMAWPRVPAIVASCAQSSKARRGEGGRSRSRRWRGESHGNAGHVAGAPDPPHLQGIEIRLRQHEAGKRRKQHLLGDAKRHACARGQEADQDVHAHVQGAPGDDGSAEERHRHHNEDLHLVGPEQREAEQITADHVGEVEENRKDEGERERHFDDARDAVERLVDHRLPALRDMTPRLDRALDSLTLFGLEYICA